MNPISSVRDNDQAQSDKTITAVVYALQAASFLVGITFIAALIVNYIKRSDVQGTWLESHFRWQIRTFWFSLLWTLIGIITFFAGVGYFVILGALVWVIYRIAKGWLRLADGRVMYDDAT